MRSFTSVILAILICLGLCACGAEDNSPAETTEGESIAETEDNAPEKTGSVFKISSAKMKGSGEALPYYSENAVSLSLPEGFEREYPEALSRQVIFSDGERKVSVRNYYLLPDAFMLNDSIASGGEIIARGDGHIIERTNDGSHIAYVLMKNGELLELGLSSFSEDEAVAIAESARLCEDTATELEIRDYMNTLVLFLHAPYEQGNSLYEINVTQLVCSQLWQSNGLIPMEVSEDGLSVTVKKADLETLAVRLLGEGTRLSYSAPAGVTYDSGAEKYTVSLSQSSLYSSFEEMYYIKDGKMEVSREEGKVLVKVTLDHSTVSLGNTSTVALLYTFTETTENGFSYLTLESIKNA